MARKNSKEFYIKKDLLGFKPDAAEEKKKYMTKSDIDKKAMIEVEESLGVEAVEGIADIARRNGEVSTDIHKKAMIESLEKSLGVVSTACKIVGISRQTHYRWMTEDTEYKKAVEGVADIALDFVESQLHKQIRNGEVSSTIFYLKTKGKKRGYIERTELSAHVNTDANPSWFDETV